MISLIKARQGIHVRLDMIPVGDDYSVILSGGDKPHIGASALAQPRPSLQQGGKISASTSVMCVLGHKEDLLAHHVAQQLASRLNSVVSVNCGIHIDDAFPTQIKVIQELVADLIEDLFAEQEKDSNL